MALEYVPSVIHWPAMEAGIIKALGGRRAFGAGRIDLLAEVERGLPVRAYVALVKTLDIDPGGRGSLAPG